MAIADELKIFKLSGKGKTISGLKRGVAETLVDLVVPEGITAIGMYAFKNCAGIQHIYFPSTLTKIDNGAFEGCTGLSEVIIPNGVTYIGSRAFAACGLENIVLPEALEHLGDYALAENPAARRYDNGVNYIGSHANPHMVCESYVNQTDVSYNIHPATRFVASGAFANCTKLKQISIPEGVLAITGNAFSGCESLVDVDIPTTLQSLGSHAFSGCVNLANIALHEGLQSIDRNAFENCASIAEIYVPSTVTMLNYFAFKGCSNLKKIYCGAKELPATWNEDWKTKCRAKVVWGAELA